MNKFVHLIFYVGFLFWGGWFILSLGKYIAYNGLSDLFEYKRAADAAIEYRETGTPEPDTLEIAFQYSVDGKVYHHQVSIFMSAVERWNMRIDEVYYNATIPSLSYLGNNKHELRKASVGMKVAGIGFAFFLSIFLFADLEKWIGVYTRGEFKSSKKS